MPTFDCFFSTIQGYLPLNTNAQKANGDVFPIVILDLNLYKDSSPMTDHEGQFSYIFTAWCPSRCEYLVFEAAPFDPSHISILSQAYYQSKEEKDDNEEDSAPLTLALTDVLLSCHSEMSNLKPQDDGRRGKYEAITRRSQE